MVFTPIAFVSASLIVTSSSSYSSIFDFMFLFCMILLNVFQFSSVPFFHIVFFDVLIVREFLY